MAKKILRKIAIATLNSSAFMKSLKDATKNGDVFVGRIMGSVRGYDVVPSPFGDAIAFKGSIAGFGSDGEESRSSKCFLPEPASTLLAEALDGREDDKASIEFGFDFSVTHDDKEGSKGYQYRTANLIEPKDADPLAALVSSAQPLRLDAPKAEAVVEEAPAEAQATPAKGGKGGK